MRACVRACVEGERTGGRVGVRVDLLVYMFWLIFRKKAFSRIGATKLNVV